MTESVEAEVQELNLTLVVDGYWVNAETGEVLELTEPQFEVKDEKSANWLMQKRLEAEGQIHGLTAQLEAVHRNIDALRHKQYQRIEFLDTRFGAQLEAFARENLPKNGKTWKCPFGKVVFRTKLERLAAKDNDTAVHWAELVGLTDAVKVTKKFLISNIPADKKNFLISNLKSIDVRQDISDYFELIPAEEIVKIDTSVRD